MSELFTLTDEKLAAVVRELMECRETGALSRRGVLHRIAHRLADEKLDKDFHIAFTIVERGVLFMAAKRWLELREDNLQRDVEESLAGELDE